MGKRNQKGQKGFTNASKSNHSNHSFVMRRRGTSSIKAAAAAPLQLNTNADTIEHVLGGGPDRRSPITYHCVKSKKPRIKRLTRGKLPAVVEEDEEDEDEDGQELDTSFASQQL